MSEPIAGMSLDCEDGCVLDSAALTLPAAPVSFRSYSSPSSYLLPSTDKRHSSPTNPLQLLSDDEDADGLESHGVTAHSLADFPAAAVQSFRQLQASAPTGRSPLFTNSASRFHPYNRQPFQHSQPPQYQLSTSQPSSPPISSSFCHSTLPLPLSTSFSSTALFNLPQPSTPSSPFTALLSGPSSAATAPVSHSSVQYHRHRLPVVSSRETVASVSCECVAALLSDISAACATFGFSRVRIIDCRFQYEYDGGHIRGAEWLTDHTDVDGLLASSIQQQEQSSSCLPPSAVADRAVPLLECVILHCEFSRHRAPSVYRAVRRRDRELTGVERFPSLYLPELCVMQSGYAAFHAAHPQLCEPHSGAYVSMLDSRYQLELKRDWKQRKSASVSSLTAQLTAPTILTRATSEGSALSHDSHGSPTPSPSPPASSLSSLSLAPHSSCPSSSYMPPAMHLGEAGPSNSRASRRRQRRDDVRLMRSASCAALRQPLSFHSLDSRIDGQSSGQHSQLDSDRYRGIEEEQRHSSSSTALANMHSGMFVSESRREMTELDVLHSSPPSSHCLFDYSAVQTSALQQSTLCVQQLLAL